MCEKPKRIASSERETVIRRSMADHEWDVWTCVPRDMRRLERSAKAFGADIEYLGDAIRVRNLPVRALTFRAKDTSKASAPDEANSRDDEGENG